MALATPTIQANMLHYLKAEESQTLVVGSAPWFEWLTGAATFAYNGPGGTFTIRTGRTIRVSTHQQVTTLAVCERTAKVRLRNEKTGS